MKTEIAQLTLRLPAGFESRARRISRLVAEALTRRNLPAGHLDRVTAGPVTVDVRRSDGVIANQVASAIHAAVVRQVQR